jgi:hypothetical protein
MIGKSGSVPCQTAIGWRRCHDVGAGIDTPRNSPERRDVRFRAVESTDRAVRVTVVNPDAIRLARTSNAGSKPQIGRTDYGWAGD